MLKWNSENVSVINMFTSGLRKVRICDPGFAVEGEDFFA
jgi:hypothetical protein